MTQDEFDDDQDTSFVPKSIPDPLNGSPQWTAWHEAQGVALFCESEQQAGEVSKFLNSKMVAPMVYLDDGA